MRWMNALVLLFAAALQAGCGPAVSPIAEKYKAQLLQQELDGQITSIQHALAAGTDDETASDEPLIVVGKIYGGDLPAFDAEKASFTIIELPEPGHDHEDPGDCVFCKRKLENAEMAVVHLVDENEAEIEIPADQLLGLMSGMNILAMGHVERVGDMLVVKAKQISILDEARASSIYKSLNGSN
jgi:hypothetical protein